MGIKERQERERQATRDAILQAARDLFVSEGYRNVSLRKIAERIEYSPAAIYSYFSSKDAIYFALAEEGFRTLAAHVGQEVHGLGNPYARIRTGLWAFYEFSKAHPGYFELMFTDRSVPSLNQDFHRFEFFHDILMHVEQDIRACVDRGQFSPGLDPGAAMHILWAGMLGAATINLAGRLAPGEDPNLLAHDVLESLLAGFSTSLRTSFVAGDCAFTAHPDSDVAVPVGPPSAARTS